MFALVAFIFFNIEAIASGSVVEGPLRVLSFLAGIVGLTFVVIMVIGDGGNAAVFGPIGHGGAERMIVYPAMLWLVAFGGYLMATPPAPPRGSPAPPTGTQGSAMRRLRRQALPPDRRALRAGTAI